MGIAMMEEIVSTVGAILKTLECPICLELLKTPVSAGCGHFFCRHCVSGILQSNYRAPCPLCKRSFTRRSVQAASQRQSVISEARSLALTCASFTGHNFPALDNFVKESKKSIDAITPVPLKKFRASNEKEENVPSRKRKSIENEDVEKAAQKSVSDMEVEEPAKVLRDDESSKKRVCPNSEDEDSGDELPSLEDVFGLRKPLPKSSAVSVIHETAKEKPLSIFPSDRLSNLKTYSSIHMKRKNSLCMNPAAVESKSAERKEDYDDYFITSNKSVTKRIEKESSEVTRGIIQIKNKVNALKNKTNEVQTDKHIQGDDSVSKLAHVKHSNEKIESIDKSKENEIISSPLLPSNVVSPQKSRLSCTKKSKRGRKKSQIQLQNSSASKSMGLNQETGNVAISSPKDCYTLDEVNLSSLQSENQDNQVTTKKVVEDPFKSMGLTDTAFSVDSVRSPLAAKTVSMIRSPGWSRVKEVKKDFKVKKFASLDVAKNSPNILLKNTVTSDQEPTPGVEKSEQSINVVKDKNENKIDSASEKALKNIHSPVENETDQEMMTEQNDQSENVSEPVNLTDINQSDSRIEMGEEMSCTSDSRCNININNSRDVLSGNPVKAKVGVSESSITITKLPAMSVKSNSVIGVNYTDICDKLSKQNVVKKIICGISNNTSFDNGVICQNGNILSKYIQDNCPEANDALFNNPSEIKEGVFPLPSQISGYRNFHTHSVVNEDDGFQYVEQSQQTSQVFNFDLQKSMYNKMNCLVEPHVFPNHVNKEKTKVVKRVCLTLEEIQDCFLKSSQTNCSETLCSLPFLDGLFKLHIGVSDDTLNVSVLKVIGTTSEANNAHSALLNKYIQTSNSFLPLSSILPSSNAGSESSQSESVKNPFPYLNKISSNEISNPDIPQSVEKSIQENEMAFKEKDVTLMPGEVNTIPECSLTEKAVGQSDCDGDMGENNMEMSEIIHFPPEPIRENKDLFQKGSESVESDHETEVCQIVDKSPLEKDVMLIVEQSPLKTKCDSKTNILSPKSPLKEAEVLIVQQSPLKTNYDSMECDLPIRHGKDLPSERNKVIQLDSDEFSNSDKEESLKKLEKCVRQESKGRGPKISRLSLKKKSKRPQVLESSDESDIENSIYVNKPIKKVEKVTSTFDKLLKPVSPKYTMSSRESDKKENLKNTVHPSATEETPSTLNSLLSEDAPENNTSEIILEIEDLADKIKSLEEKLKQCGHSELQNPLSLAQQVSSKPKTGDEQTDSEDSFDLFPQSVPPTPPNCV